MTSLEEQLYEGVSKENVAQVKELLKQGANVNVLCSTGRTVLGIAAQHGHVELVEMLLAADRFYSTPIEDHCPHRSLALHGTRSRHRHAHREWVHHLQNKTNDSSDSEPSMKLWYRTRDEVQNELKMQNRKMKSGIEELGKLDLTTVHENKPVKESELECTLVFPGGSEKQTVVGDRTDHEGKRPSTLKKGSNIGYFVFCHAEDQDNSIIVDKSEAVNSHNDDVHNTDENKNQSKNYNFSLAESQMESFWMETNGSDASYQPAVKRKEIGEEMELCSGGWTAPYEDYSELLEYTSTFLFPQRRKCDINQQDVYGRCALHYASEQEHKHVLDILIREGCQTDIADTDNVTPIHLAAARGYCDNVKSLLRAGAKVNGKTNDKTSALHIAASRGYVDVVEVLLTHGAKIDSLDASDRTPLMLAVSRMHHDVVSLLLKSGAKINIEEIHGYTPLCESVWQKDVELVRLLLSSGAKVTQSHHLLHYAVLHRHFLLAELLVQSRCIVNLRDDNGDTPLTIAARTGQKDLIELLLKNGANVNYSNGLTGSTPLHEAVEGIRGSEFPTFEIVFHQLSSYGAKLNAETFTPGDTALYRAILLEKNRAAALLIRHGSDVNLGNVYSCNVDNLCLARRRNNFYLVRLLVNAGFNMKQTPWLEVLPSEISHCYAIQSVKGWLVYMKKNPLGLAELCRLSLRQHLGETVYTRVTRSDLPERLKKYLMLEDIQEDE